MYATHAAKQTQKTTAQPHLAGTASPKDTIVYRVEGWNKNILGFLWNKGY